MGFARKKNLDPDQIRRFLEPGPVVLVSSRHEDQTDIMTMGWHMVAGFNPSLIACYIWDQNYSQELILKSKECVFNIPTVDIAPTVVQIGNCSGRDVNKFEKFGLTAEKSRKVKAPSIRECHANFECKLLETGLVKKYNLFLFKVVHARVAIAPKFPKTIHYRGRGEFMISGPTVATYRKLFAPEMLED